MVFLGAFLYNGCMDKKKLLLIDGSSVAFWAFFALYQQLDRFKNAVWFAYQCHLWLPVDVEPFVGTG